MKKYLRMSDVFKGELFIDSDCDDVIVDDLSLTVLESFSGSDAAKFAIHAINSHDELVAMNKELLAIVNNFHITEQDEDGCVWLVLNGNGTTGMAMFNLGDGGRIAAKVALHLESDRKSAIAKAKAAS